MTLKLDLSKDLESRLSIEAAKLGLAIEQHVLNLLRGATAAPKAPATGAELVAYWKHEGLIGDRSEIEDAPMHARSLREKAQRRSVA